jgi:hypothetical protein
VIEKNWQGLPLDASLLQEEIARLDAAVDAFAEVMKSKLAAKAQEGRKGWDDPRARDAIYTALLAHAAGVPMAAGQEVDVANFAMMLWRMRTGA